MNSSNLVCDSECGTRNDSVAVLRMVPRSAGFSVPQATRSPKTINANLFEPTLPFPWLKHIMKKLQSFMSPQMKIVWEYLHLIPVDFPDKIFDSKLVAVHNGST